jgi:hypothetical protein
LPTLSGTLARFYFLSNDELLEILAQTKNVQAVQVGIDILMQAVTGNRFYFLEALYESGDYLTQTLTQDAP